MGIALGIDTGGTYTDAVLVEYEADQVLAGAKALTTRHDLVIGISGAMAAVFAAAAQEGAAVDPADVTLVALSTTLATNTLAERQRGSVCLLLIGYDPALMRQYDFEHELATDDVVYLAGGHDGLGNELAPLDEAAARAAILARRDQVEAFAVSGYFAVRNPAHELRVQALVEELTGLPVTCGHELTSQLNAVRRATTVALNAHLILPLRELMASVRETLARFEISAPLMVVKGDGSLVAADWAMRRPIETILSGPAASVVGAWHLAGRQDVWTVDVGGTTTDIAALRDGWPILNRRGASVGGWRTMVEAVDVHTTGLGGDSHVRFDKLDGLRIGPQRAVPLSLLAADAPTVIEELERQVELPRGRWEDSLGEFVVLGRPPQRRLDPQDQEVLDLLAAAPQSLALLVSRSRAGSLLRRRVTDLENRGLLRRASFTPTDALHVLGRFSEWNVEAARLGATLLAQRAGMTAEALCELVIERFTQQAATELVTKILEDEIGPVEWAHDAAGAALLRRALDGRAPTNGARPAGPADLGCSLTLRWPLVAIGAPVAAYLPQVAATLHTQLIIPPHAGVANAVGAVSGSIVQRRQAFISPLDDEGTVRLHLPDGVYDFTDVEAAVAHAEAIMPDHVIALAQQAGAQHIEVRTTRHDQIAIAKGGVVEVYLGSELSFTAAGRPSPARINDGEPAADA
ncbi:MAG: Acetophenone carboxylase gamma subunit [Chloroflexi bacterium ADurb.Bin325]|nr:MAG: Acetophenone carboxylase gamma subunit [Chloroflexi bacterium ADurb.Bin325]